MNAKKILFPTDFSLLGNAALEEAAALARQQEATLLILHVHVPPTDYAGGEFYCGPSELTCESLRKTLEGVAPVDKTIPCQHRLVVGAAAEEIMRVAKQEGVGLIVMGTHGRTGLKRLLMGSVAEAVVRGAPCPVLIYKSAERSPTAAPPKAAPPKADAPRSESQPANV